MRVNKRIMLSMPDLSPKEAYALEEWMIILAHEVGLHYGDQIRSYLQCCEWEEQRMDEEMERVEADIEEVQEQEVASDSQREFPF